jgi:uncharacterized damage-inducible protein DinB
MTTTLTEIFRHNRWANERLLKSCRDLSAEQRAVADEGTYGELGYTLVHIVRAESFYLQRLTGWQPPVRWEIPGPWPGIDVLLERARFTGEQLIEIAERLDPEAPLEIWRGAAKAPTSVVLVQAINHATDHRSQASTILTQIGIAPPPIDGWNFGGFEEPSR